MFRNGHRGDVVDRLFFIGKRSPTADTRGVNWFLFPQKPIHYERSPVPFGMIVAADGGPFG